MKNQKPPFNEIKLADCKAFWNDFDFDKIRGEKFVLSPAETITDIERFVKSHIDNLESNPKNVLYTAYWIRLKMITFSFWHSQ
jgi:hypothetical protein